MPACKACGACLWDTAETKGGPNVGREYSKCRQCGKWGAWIDGMPSLKPDGPFESKAAFESKASFQSPAYSPQGRSVPIPIPYDPESRPYPSDEEPARKRPRVAEGFSEAMLNLMAGVGTMIKRFEQASTTLEKIAAALRPGDAIEDPHK